MWIAVSRTSDVELIADPSVIMATAEEVAGAKNEAKDYTDEVTGQLDTDIQQAITAAITAAKRDFWEDDNPVGTTRFLIRTSTLMKSGPVAMGVHRRK